MTIFSLTGSKRKFFLRNNHEYRVLLVLSLNYTKLTSAWISW